MSATGRNLPGNERRAYDFYETPTWCTEALLSRLNPVSSVLDPCCGRGAILNSVRNKWPYTITLGMEINYDRAAVSIDDGHDVIVRDAISDVFWQMNPGMIITNPPYSLAEEFIRRAMSEVRDRDLAFLLRLNFLGSQKRAQFHRDHPADIYVLPKRPSFTQHGTDATEYAWYVWGPGRGNRWSILDID